ncbi:MAG: polymer-forming cytoskeletal protein [Patescibacteria group bacterium]|jgi:cytoskeletal protein CcmA (bactofilin family)
MFKKDGGDEIETIIGPSVQVEGNFVANGDIIIEGVVSGSIKTEKNLRVGAGAKIYADIAAANALIAGEIQGNIKIKDNLELTNTAKVFGDIKTQVLTVAAGAALIGKCIAGEDKKTKFEKIEDKRPKEKVLPITE